jgi:hypothetical protein
MNSAAARTLFRRPLRRAALALTLLSVAACSKPPTGSGGEAATGGPKVEPWKATAVKLRKETDATAAKSALGLLSGEKLPATSDEALAALGKLVPLSEADRAELRPSAFTALDAAYLADCFYLRDAARSLGLSGVPPERQADLAFAWVCRQVYLQPWPRPYGGGYEPTALPPTAVLRRGSGSALERMYVFVALLEQLELDGVLIGGPEAANVQSREGPPLEYPYLPRLRFQRGPFWAVGVRVGTDVRMYDPWRGTPAPFTLGQLRASPDAHKGWFEAKENGSAATPDDAKKATAFLAVPVSSLSARMAAFEANLKAELGVNCAFELKDLEAKRAAFADPKPAFWNPPADPFAYGRASRAFLPADLGGTDTAPPGVRLYDSYLRDQIPASAFAAPEGLDTDGLAFARLRLAAAGALVTAFIEPPNPRERIQRGQFQDAAKDVVEKQDRFTNGLERLRRNDAAQQIREWVAAVGPLYLDLGRAETITKNKDEVAAAQAALDAHWRQPGAQFLVDQASASVGRAEASLLLALCKHEQAERLQARLERAAPAELARLKADAATAWKTAVSAWGTYEPMADAHAGFPGRAAHARALAARAAALAEAK